MIPTTVVALVAVVALTLAVVVVITDQLEDSSEQIVTSVTGVRASSGIAEAVLRHRRERLSWALRDDPEAHRRSVAALQRVEQLLQLSEEVADQAGAREAVGEVSEAFLAYRVVMAEVDLEPDESRDVIIASYLATASALDALLAATERLEQLHAGHADAVRARARRVNRTSDRLMAVAVVVLAVATGGFVLWVVRALYGPVPPLMAVLAQLRSGDLDARARPEGAEEFVTIAEGVNSLATALQEQRQSQLAFMAAVAHDLRNPMSALRMMAKRGTLDRPLPDEQEVRLFYAQVDRQVALMDRLVGDLMETAKLEAGQVELRRVPIDVAEAVEHVVALVAPTAPSHRVEVEVALRPRVYADPDRLEQVLLNLVSNAVKYSPQGGRVGIRIDRAETCAVIEISDEGIGIAPRELPRLFRPFRRAENVGGIPGTGLGLAAAARLVEAHGGKIEARSELGRGTTFRVELPMP